MSNDTTNTNDDAISDESLEAAAGGADTIDGGIIGGGCVLYPEPFPFPGEPLPFPEPYPIPGSEPWLLDQ